MPEEEITNTRSHRQLDQQRMKDRNEEDLVAHFEQLAAAQQNMPDEDEGEARDNSIRRQAKLPTQRDPKLFAVKCEPKKERELVAALLNKFLVLQSEGASPPPSPRSYDLL